MPTSLGPAEPPQRGEVLDGHASGTDEADAQAFVTCHDAIVGPCASDRGPRSTCSLPRPIEIGSDQPAVAAEVAAAAC